MEPTTLNQRYRLVELIGAGGMATVYRGQDLWLERMVAVKFLRETFANDPTFRARFVQEARAAAALDHPNIVHIYDVGEDEKRRPYIVMEIVEGEDLKDFIRRSGPVYAPKALDLVGQICDGVGNAHREGIVHCDLKPQNILVTRDGKIKVADFGIARALHKEEPQTKPESVVWGSPHYISPEQASGKTPTPASDVYSIGVILYELLTGVPPFHDSDPTNLVLKHLREAPAPPTTLNPRIPPGLEELVLATLSKEPARRYRNADQFRIAIQEYLKQGEYQTLPQPSIADTTTHSNTTSPRISLGNSLDTDEVKDTTQPIPVNTGQDFLLWGLLSVACVAVLGLVPLWLFVIKAYTSGPLNVPIEVNVTPTLSAEEQIVTVPNLMGLSAPEAQKLAEQWRLKIEVLGEQESSDAHPGTILEQTPKTGSRVAVDSTVSIIVATGRQFQLFDVVGYNIKTIQPGLESEGLLIEIEEIWSSEPQGAILKQNPAAETEIRAGQTITLTVSGGVNHPIAMQVNLNDEIMLEEARVSQLNYHAGDSIPVTLRWRSLKQVAPSYKVFIHLQTLDLSTLVAQGDKEPLRPTNTWTVGEIINDPHQVLIPQNTPPGTYQIRIGLYADANRLTIIDSGKTQVIDNTIFILNIEVLP